MLKLRRIWLFGLILLLASCVPVGGGAAIPVPQDFSPTPPQVALATPTSTAPVTPTEAVVAKQSTVADRESANCPVTQPPELPFTPPPPYRPTAPWAGSFWYGTHLLWTQVPGDGTWSGPTQKVFWWREGYSWKEDPTPQLTVTGRRLDAPAPTLSASTATNAFAEDIQSAMLVGVDFPTSGCWEITGKVADAELSFVVWIGP